MKAIEISESNDQRSGAEVEVCAFNFKCIRRSEVNPYFVDSEVLPGDSAARVDCASIVNTAVKHPLTTIDLLFFIFLSSVSYSLILGSES